MTIDTAVAPTHTAQGPLKTRLEWRDTPDGYRAIVIHPSGKETPALWAPQPGSQDLFLRMYRVPELLYEGNRGPGKTDALLMAFAQHCGPDDRSTADREAGIPKTKGWGAEWRGVIFRKTYPELEDLINKSKKWFRQVFPAARYNEAKTFWEFPDGERLYFRRFEKANDYWAYHGHAYPFIGWEELTTWFDDKCFKSMFSCNRSTAPGIPLMVRATTNPYGVGHNWVKLRYRLPVDPGALHGPLITDSVDDNGLPEPARMAIHGALIENQVLLRADPTYPQKLRASAPNPAAAAAWIDGSWDIVAGGMFDDIWFKVKARAVVRPFDVPRNWRIDRSFDWGDSKPFSVGWWATSNGEDLVFPDGRRMSTVAGDLFRIYEWYGWNGKANEGLSLTDAEIAYGIVKRELDWGIHGRVMPGPADGSIFDTENNVNIAKNMAKPVRIDGRMYSGVKWKRADKSRGSRKMGWQEIRRMLRDTMPRDGATIREHRGMFIVGERNPQWLRCVPILPRSDTDMDDVDTKVEDHNGDETRYRARHELKLVTSGPTKGHF